MPGLAVSAQATPRSRRVLGELLPVFLLALMCLLTVIWFAPGLPFPEMDSAWVLALNEATADRLVYGQDVMFNFGPWASVYTGQYHPGTGGLMLAGGGVIAVALIAGLAVVARGAARRWVVVLLPVIVATDALHDPVFMTIPLLLLAVGTGLAQSPPASSAIPRTYWTFAALLLLTIACALLSLVKSTFGTEAIALALLTLATLAAARLFRVCALMVIAYCGALLAFWTISGQLLASLPAFFRMLPLIIGGYTEGAALPGRWLDLAAYVTAAAVLLGLLYLDRERRRPGPSLIRLLGTMFTLFVAFKAGFIRHDEHALIAAGTLAMLPAVLVGALRGRSLTIAIVLNLATLSFISHHYQGYGWASFDRGRDRLVGAATGAWTWLHDPGQFHHRYDADLAWIQKQMPLPHVSGPTDIYSGGQSILLANAADYPQMRWSPRPALQSLTVFDGPMAQADLDHLQGVGGTRPAVQNVFYRVENEDNRLPTTQDGLSWPALLTAFHVTRFDRGLQIALFQRVPGASAAVPSTKPLLSGIFPVGPNVRLPELPGGIGWMTIDLRPTTAGRLASLLFRPPALFITIDYANGVTQKYRLLSGLARAGILITPQVRDTEGMLELLEPQSRAPRLRPVSFSISGESGTRYLWRRHFQLRLSAIDIPEQPQVHGLLMSEPLAQAPGADRSAGMADACTIDLIDGLDPKEQPVKVGNSMDVSGYMVISIAHGVPPDRVVVDLTAPSGRVLEGSTQRRERADIAGYFVQPALITAGFDTRIDLSSLQGPYLLKVYGERDGQRWQCKQVVKVLVAPSIDGAGSDGFRPH